MTFISYFHVCLVICLNKIKAWRAHRDAFEAAGLGNSATKFSLSDVDAAIARARGAAGRVVLVP